MARIACGHCGGVHGSVAEVRACANGAAVGAQEFVAGRPRGSPTAAEGSTSSAPGYGTGTGADSGPAVIVVDVADENALKLAGPQCLGRSVLIGPEQAVPAAWVDCRQIEVGPEVDRDVVDVLQQAWSQRERLVIRWGGNELPEPDDGAVPFHDLAPDYNVEQDRLHFFLTANTVNLSGNLLGKSSENLSGHDAGCGASFLPLNLAVANGANLLDATDAQDGDVVLTDGSTAWVDGGPLDLTLTGHDELGSAGLIPRCHLIAGSVGPLRLRSNPAGGESDSELAPDQQAAVRHRGGPARILAPAGSGKTRVLTERVRFLVDGNGIDPNTLGLVAYNRRAKEEMATRLADSRRYRRDAIRTLNSLALAIATGRNGFIGGTPATTIDEREVRRILANMMPRRRRRQLNDPLEPWIDALSMSRLGLRDPDEVADQFGGDLDGFAEVMGRYRKHLADNNLLDFDEQILRALETLLGNRAARDRARRVIPIILIDEFQDLTPAHLLLIRLIAGPANEVFAVGDDDQTIYSYSGASPKWLIQFEDYFRGAESYFLTVNYRCPAEVVAAADNLLSHNRHRVVKTITPGPAPLADETSSNSVTISDPLAVHRKGDPQENLVDHVQKLIATGAAAADIAVLARVNAALLPALMYLNEAGIPTRKPAGVDVSMLDRSGAGAALAWLRLATAPQNGLAPDDLRLALRRPPRSLHPRIVDWVCEQKSVWHLQKLAERLNTERDAASVHGLADDIADLQAMADGGVAERGAGQAADTETLLHHVLHTVGLLGAAGQLDGSQRTARRAAHSDELLALLAVSRLHPRPESFEDWLRDTLGRSPFSATGSDIAGDPTRRDRQSESDGAAVTLATIHTTKGLEWPHVIVHDVRDGLYPHRLAEDIEEERRIFHVAITRGRQSVALTCSGPPSAFVNELSEKRVEPWPTEALTKAESESAARTAKRRATASKRTDTEKKRSKPERDEPTTDGEARLRESLTGWRRERSKADGVPAYVVLNNKTLDGIAAATPQSLAELSAVPGIGPSRLEQYGDEILGVVAGIEP